MTGLVFLSQILVFCRNDEARLSGGESWILWSREAREASSLSWDSESKSRKTARTRGRRQLLALNRPRRWMHSALLSEVIYRLIRGNGALCLLRSSLSATCRIRCSLHGGRPVASHAAPSVLGRQRHCGRSSWNQTNNVRFRDFGPFLWASMFSDCMAYSQFKDTSDTCTLGWCERRWLSLCVALR